MASCYARENYHDVRCKYCGSLIKNTDYTVCRVCGKPNLNYDVTRQRKRQGEDVNA